VANPRVGRSNDRVPPLGEEPAGPERNGDAPGSREPSWVPPNPVRGDGGYLACFDADFRRDYPTLFDFLTLQGISGTARRTGTLLIFCEDAKVKGCLNDRDGGFHAFFSSDSFKGLLEGLNRDLKAGVLDWRKSKHFRR